jgi:hypothetical protein
VSKQTATRQAASGDQALSELYRASRTEQPSPAIEAAIRQAAHRQAGRRKRRWLTPLSSAAVILLGLSVTLKVGFWPPVDEQTTKEESKQAINKESAPRLEEAELQKLDITSALRSNSLPAPRQAPTPSAPATERDMSWLHKDAEYQAASPSPAAAKTRKGSTTMLLDAEQALEKIRLSIASAQIEKAIEELEKFRQNYPRLSLPPDLQRFLNDRTNK